jgi:hypothetical protein
VIDLPRIAGDNGAVETERQAMHEHEVRETPSKRPKTSVQRAAAPVSDLLSLQRLAGNSAVTQRVQRADVQIDELNQNVRPMDNAQMGAGTQEMVEGLVHDTAKLVGGSTESSESSGPSTLPPGGHATMEEEPS